MIRKFIVKENDIVNINDKFIKISGEEVRHIQVLRFDVGDEIIINKNQYKISEMRKNEIVLEFEKEAEERGVPSVNVTVYISLLKNNNLDLAIKKCVEIGAKKIVPFTSKNTIVKLTDKDKPKRVEKFKKIVEEACKQCGRTDDIEVDMIQDLKVIDFKESKVLFAYEASKDSLRNEINDIKEKSIKDIGIIIGPEGGFDSKEVEYLKQKDNIVEVSLGTRILRAETAALNLLSIVMYETEL